LPRQLGRQANRNVFFVEKSEKKIFKILQRIKLKNYKIVLKNNIFDLHKKIGSPSQYIYKNILKLKYD
jgi:histone deacetylase complex regulatory component SIN3